MGLGVWSLMTISLTWQPRQGPAHATRISDHDFSRFCNDIATSPFVNEIDAIMSGYFASPQQVASAAQLINKLKANRPDIAYLCDPVMGDEGGLYIATETAQTIRTELLPIADIIKPNISELEWICGRKLNNNQEIAAATAHYPARIKLITSAFAHEKDATANLLIDDNQIWLVEHPLLSEPVNGLGDLTASLFFAHFLQDMPIKLALQNATASVFDCLQYTLGEKANELQLAQTQSFFTHPVSPVNLTCLQS